jgi:hypothetical protein
LSKEWGPPHYLGRYGTKESRERYSRVIAEWLANGRQVVDQQSGLTISQLMLAYVRHAKQYYRKPNGKPTSAVLPAACDPSPARAVRQHEVC